ncbi:disease resistance protein RPM1 [Cannabis sativa]|uniref:disease resistance protein RPM1 n=1 Tax=Cannabis sativa TaxID=3483 RepID=UPI0029CA09CC|nr:disease resistance protein RPM1 [Cannabis sativa]XP_060973020.1 disease resistance protein RPM1 [Cannabis sativa]XP_060973021.1 disease resistance protein RPM1 [Cannabis sativa]
MAETFLTPVIESLIQLLKDEVRSFKGVHKEVESLKKELEIIQSLFKDTDERELASNAVKIWMKQLREQADHIEDVVDEYRWHLAQGATDKSGFIGFFSKIGARIKALKSRYPLSSHIKDINQSLRRIKETGQGFALGHSLQRVQGSTSKNSCIEEQDLRLGSHFVEQDDEYLDVPLAHNKLKNSLVEGMSARMIVSLVGEGGIGKTTLVKKVYDEVKHKFDCHAWITVSKSYDVIASLKGTMKQIGLTAECTSFDYDTMIQELITPLRQHLETKKYVIILDDVWDAGFWEKMKYALPSNDNGSRVIITTRNETVAPCDDAIQRLEIWSHSMAFELFCKKAFKHDFKGCCPEELVKLSHEILKKCQGLPLAIGAIAGLLSRKKKVQSEWRKVLNDIDFEFRTNPQLLWISEGLVQARETKSLQEEAKGYLNELVERSLVSIELMYGRGKGCKVHDLMHEFILSRVKDLGFCQILAKNKFEFGEYKHRRLSIHGSIPQTIIKTIQQCTTVRSIFLQNFNDDDQWNGKYFLIALFKNLKLLKVLDIDDGTLDYLPKEVGKLFHLRLLDLSFSKIKVLPESIGQLHNLQHLNLERTGVDKLPKSIGKLHNLLILDLWNTFVRELPKEINKLRNLHSLFASHMKYFIEMEEDLFGVKIQEGFGNLENLEMLEFVELHEDVGGFTKELENLSKLKTLGVTNVTKESSRAICAVAAKKLSHLEYLCLDTKDADEFLDLEPISSSPPPFMQSLELSGRLSKFPHWVSGLSNLESFILCSSKLAVNPLKYLKDLPNLICCRLYDNSYEGEELHFEEGGFPKLNELRLINLSELKLMKIDKGALPLLTTLFICSCPQMERLPYGIQYLPKLKEFCSWNMSEDFMDQVKENEGPDYSKIQHLPILNIK